MKKKLLLLFVVVVLSFSCALTVAAETKSLDGEHQHQYNIIVDRNILNAYTYTHQYLNEECIVTVYHISWFKKCDYCDSKIGPFNEIKENHGSCGR